MLLRATDVRGAVRVAERIRASVEALSARFEKSLIPVTVSGGAAALSDGGDSFGQCTARPRGRAPVWRQTRGQEPHRGGSARGGLILGSCRAWLESEVSSPSPPTLPEPLLALVRERVGNDALAEVPADGAVAAACELLRRELDWTRALGASCSTWSAASATGWRGSMASATHPAPSSSWPEGWRPRASAGSARFARCPTIFAARSPSSRPTSGSCVTRARFADDETGRGARRHLPGDPAGRGASTAITSVATFDSEPGRGRDRAGRRERHRGAPGAAVPCAAGRQTSRGDHARLARCPFGD